MSDLRWLDDMDPFAAETESELEELEQNVYHVIEQDKGSNLDCPNRGLGAASATSKALPSGLAAQAENEIEQLDDRIDSCTAELTTADDGSVTLDLDVRVDGDVLDIGVPIGGES